MKRQEVFTEDQVFHGFGKFDDLGVGVNYEMYDFNVERANRDQLQACNHCGRGLNPDRTYVAIHDLWQAFISIDASEEQFDSYRNSEGGLIWHIVFLGSECAKQLPAKFRVLQNEVPAWWADSTMFSDEALWGTW